MIDYKKLSVKEIIDLLIKSDIQYYNLGEPIFNDDEYDEIKEYLKTIDKKNDYFKRVGADVAIDNKVKLPFYEEATNGKFNNKKAKVHYDNLVEELFNRGINFEQIEFQEILGKIEVIGELLIKSKDLI